MDAIPPTGPTPDPNPFEPPHSPGERPRIRRYRPMSILARVAGGGAVVLAGVIAFVGTCVPLGIGALAAGADSGLFVMAWMVGATVAGLAMFGVFRLVFLSPRRELPPDEGTRP